ncbi:ketopantoate reductase family protein [Brevibacillus sp. SYSU BS000544]|uniref:ketopantoate reductase family protein n=1 Tax=Brevibacillus sp. SYSU BS000544 TaxID=3416443 RepID=UPI003CE46011
MQVVVVGGGSVGLLMAARLHLGGCLVKLVTRSEEQASLLNKQAIVMQTLDNHIVKAPVTATSYQDKWPNADVYLLAVKQTQLPDLLSAISQLPAGARVVALQNGMGHYELLQEVVSQNRLFLAMNTEGYRRMSQTQVRHTGNGVIRFGPWETQEMRDEVITSFIQLANSCGIPFTYENGIQPFLWKKLIANAVINPVTALFEVANGQLLESTELLDIMRQVFDEAAFVASQYGHKIAEIDWQDILLICRNTSQNYSSMLQDLLHGKQTEIDAITGYIVDKAHTYHIKTPMNESLYRAVTMKSSLR